MENYQELNTLATATYEEKLKALCDLITKESDERMKTNYNILYTTSMQEKGRCTLIEVHPGTVYDKLTSKDYGSGCYVKYFVHKVTGRIVGAASFNSQNFNREYGTLDTISDWYWGEYYGISKTGKNTLVPKAQRLNVKKK